MRLSEIDEVLLESVTGLFSKEVRSEFVEMLSEDRGYGRRSLSQIRELFDMDAAPDGWDRFRRSFMGNISNWYLAGLMRADPDYHWSESLVLLWLLSPKLFVYVCCCLVSRSWPSIFSTGSNIQTIFLASSGAHPLMLEEAMRIHESGHYSDVVDMRLRLSDGLSCSALRILEEAMLEAMFTNPKFFTPRSRSSVKSNRSDPVVKSRVVNLLLGSTWFGNTNANNFYAFVKNVLTSYENGELYTTTSDQEREAVE